MKKKTNNIEKFIYKCEIYSPLPDKLIEELFVKASSQIDAKQKAVKISTKTNILLITAQKIYCYE